MRKKLSRNFYNQKTLKVARDLLGKYLVRKIKGQRISGKIIETEAYIGPKDRASHAFSWKITERNKAEYLQGGHLYVYLCYGIHWQLNVVTGPEGYPECVLIRALEMEGDFQKKLSDGPGKLCQRMKIDKSFNKEDLCRSKRIWIEDRGEKTGSVESSRRIGIDYAGEWAKKPWRFCLRGNDFALRKQRL
jgi:DNA-3-methyladenine glycosylase